MPAYLIARVAVTNIEKYKQYLNVVPGVIEKFEGKYVSRAGKTVTLEGSDETRRIIIIEFPTLERAKDFYNSTEYQEAKKLRKDAAIGEMIVVEGTE